MTGQVFVVEGTSFSGVNGSENQQANHCFEGPVKHCTPRTMSETLGSRPQATNPRAELDGPFGATYGDITNGAYELTHVVVQQPVDVSSAEGLRQRGALESTGAVNPSQLM